MFTLTLNSSYRIHGSLQLHRLQTTDRSCGPRPPCVQAKGAENTRELSRKRGGSSLTKARRS